MNGALITYLTVTMECECDKEVTFFFALDAADLALFSNIANQVDVAL
jgi:hypothetical protein